MKSRKKLSQSFPIFYSMLLVNKNNIQLNKREKNGKVLRRERERKVSKLERETKRGRGSTNRDQCTFTSMVNNHEPLWAYDMIEM